MLWGCNGGAGGRAQEGGAGLTCPVAGQTVCARRCRMAAPACAVQECSYTAHGCPDYIPETPPKKTQVQTVCVARTWGTQGPWSPIHRNMKGGRGPMDANTTGPTPRLPLSLLHGLLRLARGAAPPPGPPRGFPCLPCARCAAVAVQSPAAVLMCALIPRGMKVDDKVRRCCRAAAGEGGWATPLPSAIMCRACTSNPSFGPKDPLLPLLQVDPHCRPFHRTDYVRHMPAAEAQS